MNCNDAAEFVSALCDGETIPPEAAHHVGACSECQARLRDYLSTGAELRRVASLEHAAPIPPFDTQTTIRSRTSLWQRGWETMRIPKLAFVSMILGLLALASSLAVIKVRARSEGTVLSLTTDVGHDKPVICALSTVDQSQKQCEYFGTNNGKPVGYQWKLLARDGDRVQIEFRSRMYSAVTGGQSFGPSDLDHEPAQQTWLHPGETLTLNAPGIGNVHVTGEWLDHMPMLPPLGAEERFDPAPAELRFLSPLLLRDKEVVGDLEGAAAKMDKPQEAAWVYFPREGSFIISVSHMEGSREAIANMNRVSFDEDGRSYTFITGSPVSREKRVWVLHQPDFEPEAPQAADHAFLGELTLREKSPGLWESPLKSHQ